MSLVSRLDKIAATIATKESPRRQVVRQIIDGVDDQEVVLDRMVANGEMAEHQRGDVRFIRRVIVAPIWDMKPDGSARLVGRRNVHTGEVEKVEGWRVISARGELRLMSCAARSTSASVIHIWRRLKENGPGIPWEGLFTEPLPKEEQAVDFLTLPSTHDHAEPMNRSPNPAVAGDIRGHLAAASHMR